MGVVVVFGTEQIKSAETATLIQGIQSLYCANAAESIKTAQTELNRYSPSEPLPSFCRKSSFCRLFEVFFREIRVGSGGEVRMEEVGA